MKFIEELHCKSLNANANEVSEEEYDFLYKKVFFSINFIHLQLLDI